MGFIQTLSGKKFDYINSTIDDIDIEDSGRIKISVPVSWTNIKAIWAKGVEHFAAALKQETL